MQAALGHKVRIDGIDDSYEVVIPAGTQSGTQLRVRGAGLPPLHGGRRGDIVVEIEVEVPRKLSDGEVTLLREFAELRGEKRAESEAGGLLGALFKKKS